MPWLSFSVVFLSGTIGYMALNVLLMGHGIGNVGDAGNACLPITTMMNSGKLSGLGVPEQ